MTVHQVSFELGGKTVTIESGKMAKQAGGSIVIRCGDSMLLVVATASQEIKEGIDFLPLTVEYIEKTYAAGRIPGGFFKREGRPTEESILVARCIDRPIRPLFPEHYYYDTQVIAQVLSADAFCPPDLLAIIGGSAALVLSDIPLIKPIAGCRVSKINGKLVINANLDDMHQAELNLIVAASEDAVVMVEGEADGASEELVLEAIQFAHESIKPAIKAQLELQKKCGKAKRVIEAPAINQTIRDAVMTKRADVKAALAIRDKLDRYSKLKDIKSEIKKLVLTDDSSKAEALQFAADFENLKSEIMRGDILNESKRIDGRGMKDIRPIACEVGLLPKAHGSALFTRGETQALVIATLGSSDDEQTIDGLLRQDSKTFMLNYNFPGFSVGEVKPLRSPGRREIGHGNLAERALASHLPSSEEFPYTIRLVSEILESNGSSSMASVCGGSLALMDAGVPVKSPVAGIAMGLIKDGDKFAILSDILGDEDHLGDMDFKVTGNAEGVTAIQMDIKIEGITSEIMKSALSQAREGRLHILSKMSEALSMPRPELADTAPRFSQVSIRPDRIKDLIGPGGKNIKNIVEISRAKIDIEDDGRVRIFAMDQNSADLAIRMINELTAEAEIGKIYTGPIKKITDFGAFVEILPKTDGLLHISQIVDRRLKDVGEVLREGDVVSVKVLNVDNFGKIKLSMKEVPQSEEITKILSA